MEPALVTLGVGIILGYLAQRSRFCLIGGLRDFILVHDTELLKGAIAFFITAWVAFSVAGYMGLVELQTPKFQNLAQAASSSVSFDIPPNSNSLTSSMPQITWTNWAVWVLSAIAGIALGLLSTLANGCPTRQHVLAAQGVQDSLFYLLGFYGGVIVFYLVTKPLIALFM